MKSEIRNPKSALDPEAEQARQDRLENSLQAIVTLWLLLLAGTIADYFDDARHWLAWRRVCAWCVPPRRIGGNPFARLVTHTICPRCRAKFSSDRNDSKNVIRSSAPPFGADAVAGKPLVRRRVAMLPRSSRGDRLGGTGGGELRHTH